ncbi:egf family domain-containing protein, partial [Cystoisospora suis]
MAAPAVIAAGALLFWVAPVSGFVNLPSQSSWVCRTSETGQRCGNSFVNQVTKEKGGICRAGNCCKDVAVGPNNALGEFCAADDGSNCKSNFLEQFSFGKCSLKEKCHMCSPHSVCNFDDSANGGVWCQCVAPGVGNGITCDKDPCFGNPCSNGICSRNPDQPDDFSCKCYPGYTFSGDELGALKGCVNACRTGICGDGAAHCLNGESTHMCLCKE